MRSPAGTETVRVTEVVEVTVMVLAPEEWLFKAVLGLAGAALATATVQDWQCLSCCNSLSISVKA